MDIKEERPAYVKFEIRPMEDRAATEAAGHYVAKNVEFALITPPYSKDRVEQVCSDWLKQLDENVTANRLPSQWRDQYKQAYQAWKSGNEIPVNGTAIKGWPIISPAQQENLIAIGVRTVEDLAIMNDEGVHRFGMGAIDLRNKAQAWLRSAKDNGKITIENANLKAQMDALQSNLSILQEKYTAAGAVDVESLQERNRLQAERIALLEQENSELALNQKAKPGRKPSA
jgi:hypothetical protein